jgi:UDP-hydrolysing UDP-N-acetyl-D-glucosamine 2-epimerase
VVELASIFERLEPDVVVSVADRYETIATAIAASYMNLPLAHVQGGEVTGSIDEKVRHAVTKLADIHLVATELAASRVIRLGEEPDHVFLTGCPSIDLADRVASEPEVFDPFDLYAGVGHEFSVDQDYLVIMQHPVTTEYLDAAKQIDATLDALTRIDLPVFFFWPNVDAGSDRISKRIRQFREENDLPHVYFFKNLPPEDFLRLISRARCVIGNSSVGIRECSFLGIPVVNIGSRQQGRERGPNVIDVDSDAGQIVDALQQHLGAEPLERVHLYGDGRAGVRIAEVLATCGLSIDKRLTY